ncbi:MAG TPA: PRC-barrel domain-containing protein [Caulobacteraceae bacterium]|jgi:sporulation protein YlmC with PRC-barrel domain
MSETLFKGADVHGMHVSGIDGDKLGAVREIFLELASGQIGFLVIEAAGLLGGSGKFHPVPWSAVCYDPVARSFQLEMTKNDFKASPSYDRDQLANRSHGWDEQSARYFEATQP